jgi:hypothetical protein
MMNPPAIVLMGLIVIGIQVIIIVMARELLVHLFHKVFALVQLVVYGPLIVLLIVLEKIVGAMVAVGLAEVMGADVKAGIDVIATGYVLQILLVVELVLELFIVSI